MHVLEITSIVNRAPLRHALKAGAALGDQHGSVAVHTLDDRHMAVTSVGAELACAEHHRGADVRRAVDQIAEAAAGVRPILPIAHV